MRRSGFKGPQRFAILSADDARAATGLELHELVDRKDVQRLTRTLPDGRPEDAFRLPVELAGDFAPPAP